MSEEKRVLLKEANFPSNSNEAKKEPVIEKKKLEKIVTGKVRKQKSSFSKKMAETFLEDTGGNVVNYAIHDVLIPAAKSLVCDIVGWGGMAEMILFGNVRGRSASRGGVLSHTNYNSISAGNSTVRGGRDLSRAAREHHDFGQITLDSRGEAEEVLSHLVDLTIDFGVATVADLYNLVGITESFTDHKWGWTDLGSASVTRVRDGYLLNLPRTKLLD